MSLIRTCIYMYMKTKVEIVSETLDFIISLIIYLILFIYSWIVLYNLLCLCDPNKYIEGSIKKVGKKWKESDLMQGHSVLWGWKQVWCAWKTSQKMQFKCYGAPNGNKSAECVQITPSNTGLGYIYPSTRQLYNQCFQWIGIHVSEVKGLKTH